MDGAVSAKEAAAMSLSVERSVGGPSVLPLPIGISDYRTASTEYYYVDKTMMIKEFLDERPKVSLFTRPRRFLS